MGDATLRLVDAAGQPVEGVQVEIEQTSHDFYFGANSFMLRGYPNEAQNELWEARYKALFNQTVVPFYWRDLEPEQGKPRYAADSPPLHRRPPPDLVLDWCAANNVAPKGHNLLWNIYLPDWLPRDPDALYTLTERHFAEIAERYDHRIPVWDVVNEYLVDRPGFPMPPGYLLWAYKLADRLFPNGKLFVNETTGDSWINAGRDETPFCLLIQDLQERGARIEGIGLQFHLFGFLEQVLERRPALLDPAFLLQTLDQYATFDLPVHVSEITVPAAGQVDDPEQVQAELTCGLYKTWFSHPNVEAIVWWNLADGAAFRDEGQYRGGLLDENLNPKPAYDALDQLINDEWKTRASAAAADTFSFRGFYGRYQVSLEHAGRQRSHQIHLTKGAPNQFELQV
jgi:GH35 family endo-1,4-beta-xylanase